MADKKHIRTFRSKKLDAEHVKLLNDAIRKNVKGGDVSVHISYKKENGIATDRCVKPLGVKGTSLLLAHCKNRDALRSFRLERIGMVKSAFWSGFEKRATLDPETRSAYEKEMYDWNREHTNFSGNFKRLLPAVAAGALLGGAHGKVTGGSLLGGAAAGSAATALGGATLAGLGTAFWKLRSPKYLKRITDDNLERGIMSIRRKQHGDD